MTQKISQTAVTCCAQLPSQTLADLLARYQMEIEFVEEQTPVPGSFWGDSEAGLIHNKLYVRGDTPVHSALHEACHYICMDQSRRENLHTDAGGHYDEENGVCYLQIVLADHLAGFDRDRMLQDMDRWGYSFRLGSSRAWFEKDAEDAIDWLRQYDLLDATLQPTWQLRR